MRYLVLTGGGSRGAWQAGRMLKLYREGVRWDAVVGTSVGAVNAVGLSYLGAEGTYSLWQGLDGRKSVMSFNWAMPWNFTGIYTFKPLRKLIEQKIQGLAPSIPAYACAIDTRTANLEYLKLEGTIQEVASRVIASCVVCGIQTPEKGIYVDGGHREIAPVTWAKESGAIKVDVIGTGPADELLEFAEPKKGMWFPITWYAMRAIDMMTHEIWLRDLDAMPKRQVTVHAPKKGITLDSLDYSKKALSELLDMGLNGE